MFLKYTKHYKVNKTSLYATVKLIIAERIRFTLVIKSSQSDAEFSVAIKHSAASYNFITFLKGVKSHLSYVKIYVRMRVV